MASSTAELSVSSYLPYDIHGITTALVKNPNNLDLALARVDVLVNLGMLEEANKQLNLSRAKHFYVPEVFEKRVNFFLSIGVLEKAKSELRLVRPEMRVSFQNEIEQVEDVSIKMREFRLARKWEEALENIEKAISLGVVNSRMVLTYKTEVLLELNKFREAKDAFNKALKMDAEPIAVHFHDIEPRAYFHLISAYMELACGKISTAEFEAGEAHCQDRQNQQIIDIFSSLKEVKLAYNRGMTLYKRCAYDEALEEFHLALRLAKRKSACLWNRIAACHLHAKRFKECTSAARMVLHWMPDDEVAVDLLDSVQMALVTTLPENNEKAEEVLEIVKKALIAALPNNEKAQEVLDSMQKALMAALLPDDEKEKGVLDSKASEMGGASLGSGTDD